MWRRSVSAWSGLRDRWFLPLWIPVLGLGAAAIADYDDARWMAREGLDVLAGGGIVHPDRWGWAPVPHDFVPTSPGWDVVLGMAWHLGREPGLLIATAATLAACLWVVALAARALGAGDTAIIAALLTGFVVMGSFLNPRASVVAVALLLLQFLLVRRSNSTVRIALSGFLCAYAGIWIHGSWTALALAAAVGNVWLIHGDRQADRNSRRTRALVGAIAPPLGALAGPLGTDAWTNAARVAEQCRSVITEWSTPWALGGADLALWLALLAATAALLWFAAQERSLQLRQLLALLALGAVIAGAVAARFMLIGGFLALPVLASALGRGLPWDRIRRCLGERGHERYWRNIATLLLILAIPTDIAALAMHAYGPDPAILSLPGHCRLFASDKLSKPISLYRPDVQTWVDGRQDYWGRIRMQQMQGYLLVTRPSALLPAGTSCVLLERNPAPPLADRLQASPDWRLVAQSPGLTVWARRA